jgi:hypothetical protein
VGLPVLGGRPVRAGHRRVRVDPSGQARTITGVVPGDVITDRAPTYLRVLEQVCPAAWHHIERYANNGVEATTPS